MARETKEWVGKTDDSAFPQSLKIRMFEKSRGFCQKCAVNIKLKPWELDHKIRLKDGGENRERNLQVLCKACHLDKTGGENKSQAKANRVKARTYGIKKAPKRIMPGSKASKWKKKVDGTVVLRETDK